MQVGRHLAVVFWSRVAFFTHCFCVGEPVLLLHRARFRCGSHLVITCGGLI